MSVVTTRRLSLPRMTRLCLRIRREGWKVLRIDVDMTIHDMAMTRFGQWWRRAVRCGHAYAEGSARYGRTAERHFVRQLRSTLSCGLLLPAFALRPGLANSRCKPLVLLCAVFDLVLADRALLSDRIGNGPRQTLGITAAFCVLAKFPQVVGIVKYWSRYIRGKPAQLIEYRGASTAAATTHLELNPSNYDGIH